MPRPARAARAGKHGKRPRRIRVTAEQFRDARVFAGFSREDAAEFCGVSLRTIGHWETGKARPAWAAFKLLRVYRHGDLIDPAWGGFAIVRGHLVTPEQHSLAPHDLTWLSLLVRRAAAFSDLLREREAAWPQAAAAAAASSAAGLVHTETTHASQSQQGFGWSGAGRSPVAMAHGCAALLPAVGPALAKPSGPEATPHGEPLLLWRAGQSLPWLDGYPILQTAQEAAFR